MSDIPFLAYQFISLSRLITGVARCTRSLCSLSHQIADRPLITDWSPQTVLSLRALVRNHGTRNQSRTYRILEYYLMCCSTRLTVRSGTIFCCILYASHIAHIKCQLCQICSCPRRIWSTSDLNKAKLEGDVLMITSGNNTKR